MEDYDSGIDEEAPSAPLRVFPLATKFEAWPGLKPPLLVRLSGVPGYGVVGDVGDWPTQAALERIGVSRAVWSSASESLRVTLQGAAELQRALQELVGAVVGTTVHPRDRDEASRLALAAMKTLREALAKLRDSRQGELARLRRHLAQGVLRHERTLVLDGLSEAKRMLSQTRTPRAELLEAMAAALNQKFIDNVAHSHIRVSADDLRSLRTRQPTEVMLRVLGHRRFGDDLRVSNDDLVRSSLRAPRTRRRPR